MWRFFQTTPERRTANRLKSDSAAAANLQPAGVVRDRVVRGGTERREDAGETRHPAEPDMARPLPRDVDAEVVADRRLVRALVADVNDAVSYGYVSPYVMSVTRI